MIHLLQKYRAHLMLLFASSLAGLFLAEGILTAYLMVKHGKVGRDQLIRMREELRDDVVGGIGNRFENRLVLHPFFGYTYNPKDQNINNFGFRTKYNISLGRSGYSIENNLRNEPLVIGIFGGSFAEMITASANEYLEHKVKAIFPNKTPIIMNFAVGGHALPQSAFIYIYFKELFDVVIFIDGLNELWNYVGNNKAGFPPEYAKAAHYTYKISRQELTPIQFQHTAEIISLKRQLDTITSISLLPIMRQSVVVHYTWRALNSLWSRRVSAISRDIEKSYESKKRVFATEEDNTILDYAAHRWRSYHNLIHSLASAQGILAIHALQPNPFVPDSKTLTPEEKNLIENSYPIRDYVVNGYPKLQSKISNLRRQGVIVEDLTDIFKVINTPIWLDAAHPNEEGARLIMDKIVELIRANKNAISDRRELEVFNETDTVSSKCALTAIRPSAPKRSLQPTAFHYAPDCGEFNR
jgi:hypothetical protein